MNKAATGVTIRDRFKNLVEIPESLPTQYDNQDFEEQPEDGKWCRLSIIPADSAQATAVNSPGGGQMFRTSGIFIASIYFPFNTGTALQDELADRVARAFSAKTYDAVVFRAASIARVGRAGKWWQVNVTATWYSDSFAT